MNAGINAHAAAQCMNTFGVARFVVNINDSGVTILRAEDYPSYVWLCEKLRETPVPPEKW